MCMPGREAMYSCRKKSFLTLCVLFLHIPAGAQQDTTAVTDSLLVRTLQEQMTPPQPPVVVPRSVPSINPDMSVVGDIRASYLTPAERHFDLEFSEAEIALQSVVDPYGRADFFISVARDPATGKFGLDLEEAFLTSLDLPAGLQLKAGKFRSAFGKINPLHPHVLPFIDVPAVYLNYFGDEGLNDEGLSLSWLVPNPLDFYQEFTLQATRGPEDNPGFARSAVDRYLYLGHLKNFWDLTENATLELGLSAAAGPNDALFSTFIGGIDLTYKWKPLQFNDYQSVVLQAEAVWCDKKISEPERVKSWGMYALATCQLEKRLFLTARFDYSNRPDDASFAERGYAGIFGWQATEFQKVELEVKTANSNTFSDVSQVLLRSTFTIGAHGAHQY